ncbi:hypothetical protein [Veillonella atypica]|uniref:hypothetical protein n=2 Tax=Veillonella TaxID=29465 RepID=UPI003AEF92A2
MARRKIVLVIVEGPSDADSLELYFSKFFDSNTVHMKIMYGDITSKRGINQSNIKARLGNEIKVYAENNHFKAADVQQIIHLVDMDGAFVDDSVIIEDETKDKFVYTLKSVIVPNRQVAIERNEHKRENLNVLSSRTSVMWNNIPYKIYYMSCNLDHVLHDSPNATDEEKKVNSLTFNDKYYNDIDAFVRFIRESTFSQCTGYKESWDYIKQDNHSLERNSNLGLCFI